MDPKEYQELRRAVERIERAVIGEPSSGTTGLVTRVATLERKVADLVVKAAAVAGGISVLVWAARALTGH